MIKLKRVKNKFCVLIVLGLNLYSFQSCNNFVKSKAEKAPDQLFDLIANENKDTIEIEIFQLAPTDVESYKNRSFLLTINDKKINTIIANKAFGKDAYEKLFNEHWDSKYDWLINSMLYSKFRLNAFELSEFAPNNVLDWRVKNKNKDFAIWKHYFER